MAHLTTQKTDYRGNDVALAGLVLSVLTFWLFAQSTLNIGPLMAEDLGISASLLNVAIAITALFSGMFIVALGGMADRFGRVRLAIIGNGLNIAGSLCIVVAGATLPAVMLLLGRILQGLAAASIMPATLSLVRTYWSGADRQRAVSMWSIGSWGGTSVAAFLSGMLSATALGWVSVFYVSIAVSLVAIAIISRIPESAPAKGVSSHTDYAGIITLALSMVALQIVVTMGADLGWLSPTIVALAVTFAVVFWLFLRAERRAHHPIVDLAVFKDLVFTGATLSNFLANATAGLIPVSMWVIQSGADMTPEQTGYLTIGYAVALIGCIRVGEKLQQKVGSKAPMSAGLILVVIAITLLMATNVTTHTYVVLVIIAFTVYGLGLALYATPSTDAALTSLPPEHTGAGAGIYKMASSLGAAFGVAIPTAMFTAFNTDGVAWLPEAIAFVGVQHNIAERQAGMVAMGSVWIMAVIALAATLLVLPRGAGKDMHLDGADAADAA
ncbi:MFS transporter [Corynebacterium uterequi]|uniref:Major Facilitator Superfamily transporter n=1 Tax=Corynebacterium uterequi TaxID=1072256 RepID=A0A0G3HD63_9CORY|nr:MFS transporter [Corynebacterium uterequi]AKK10610.1 Major Facilitator Superfamily transporter [Corynebacterium uterequi]